MKPQVIFQKESGRSTTIFGQSSFFFEPPVFALFLMESSAIYHGTLGYDNESLNAFAKFIQDEQRKKCMSRHKAKKAEEKKHAVMKALQCYDFEPRVIRWSHRNIKTKENKNCDVEECATIAIRYVDVQYRHKRVTCYMCLSHYNTAHRVLTFLP